MITKEVRNTQDPKREQAGVKFSPTKPESVSGVDESAAEIEEKTSGAPLPNAIKVTPASDSDILNLLTIYSMEGDKYSSAVDAKLYIKMKSKSNPTGINSTYFQTVPMG